MKKLVFLLTFLSLLIYGTYYVLFVPSEWERTTPKYSIEVTLEVLTSSLQYYKDSYGCFPSTDQGLTALLKKGVLMHLPQAPWGNDFYYKKEGSHYAYQLCSLGQDGKIGGKGSNKDICSPK